MTTEERKSILCRSRGLKSSNTHAHGPIHMHVLLALIQLSRLKQQQQKMQTKDKMKENTLYRE